MRKVPDLIFAILLVAVPVNADAQERKSCNYGANPLAWPFEWQLCGLTFLRGERKASHEATAVPSETSAATKPAESAPVAQEGSTPLLDKALQLVVPNLILPPPGLARRPSPNPASSSAVAAPTYVPPAPEYDRTPSTPAAADLLGKRSAPAVRNLDESTR